MAKITPYVAERHPELFDAPSTSVRTAIPERTFWEKATILHQEANRPETKTMPRRYSRHYYDMYRLGHSEIADRAIAHPELFAKVVAFKEKFYRRPGPSWPMQDPARSSWCLWATGCRNCNSTTTPCGPCSSAKSRHSKTCSPS